VIGSAPTHLTPAQRAEQFRFAGADCSDPRIFPTRQMPVLNRSYFSYKPGDREWRMVGVQGFAADAVASVGVIGRDNQIIYTVPVEKNVYTAGKRGFIGARGVVALNDKGKVLWVQCFALGPPRQNFPSGGCGSYQNSPLPKLPPQRLPRPPIEAPGPLVAQHGSADGATVDIRGSRIAMNFTRVPSATRRLLPSKTGRLTLGCFKLVTIAGVRGTDGHTPPSRSRTSSGCARTAPSRLGRPAHPSMAAQQWAHSVTPGTTHTAPTTQSRFHSRPKGAPISPTVQSHATSPGSHAPGSSERSDTRCDHSPRRRPHAP
jgi:hypothetical protein